MKQSPWPHVMPRWLAWGRFVAEDIVVRVGDPWLVTKYVLLKLEAPWAHVFLSLTLVQPLRLFLIRLHRTQVNGFLELDGVELPSVSSLVRCAHQGGQEPTKAHENYNEIFLSIDNRCDGFSISIFQSLISFEKLCRSHLSDLDFDFSRPDSCKIRCFSRFFMHKARPSFLLE